MKLISRWVGLCIKLANSLLIQYMVHRSLLLGPEGGDPVSNNLTYCLVRALSNPYKLCH